MNNFIFSYFTHRQMKFFILKQSKNITKKLLKSRKINLDIESFSLKQIKNGSFEVHSEFGIDRKNLHELISEAFSPIATFCKQAPFTHVHRIKYKIKDEIFSRCKVHQKLQYNYDMKIIKFVLEYFIIIKANAYKII